MSPKQGVSEVPYYPMMDGYWYPYMGFGMSLVWLIFLIVVAYLIYRLIKHEKIFAPSNPIVKTPEDILAERYAKGELTREQFMQMKEDLKKTQ
jgi:putative membrane protein